MKRLILIATIFLGLNAFGQFSAGNTYIDQIDTTICNGDSVQLNMFSGGTNTNSLAFIENQYATIPNNGFFSTANQYTVEFWYKQTGCTGGDEHIFGIDWYAQKLYFSIGNGCNTLNFLRDQTLIPYLTGSWTHIAGVKDGSTIYLYINGILALSEPFIATSTPGSGNITINHHTWSSGSSSRLSGFFDELRVSDTVRYTSNFIPPVNEFLNDANTIYLMHFNGDMTDELGNSGATNGATWSNDTPFNTYAYSNVSYLWSTGDTTSSVSVQPAVTTTYYATISYGSATYTDSVTITVNSLSTLSAGANQMVCAGTAVTLNGSGASSYSWNNGVTNAVAFTPLTTQTYTVSGINANGCANTAQATITVNPLPTVSAGANQSVCAGTAVTLNGSGATSYVWNNGVTNAVAFTPLTTQTYTVTGTDANGCVNTSQATITVNPLPTVSAGANQTVCAGTSVTLNGNGASSYVWNGGVTNAVAFTPVSTQTYTVTGINANGCVNSAQATITVIFPMVSGGANQSVCAGTAVTLNGSGASSYAWNNGVTNAVAFTPVSSQTYTLIGTDTLGCQGTDTVMVTVLENAASSLTQTALDFYMLNGQTYTQSGTYTQVVPAANGCDSTITLNLTLNFTGIHELGTATKILVKITDLNGKTIPRRKNTVMLFIYEDGTVERVVEME
jgi:hypothetical protein